MIFFLYKANGKTEQVFRDTTEWGNYIVGHCLLLLHLSVPTHHPLATPPWIGNMAK